MSIEDKEQLQKQMNEAVMASFQDDGAIAEFLEFNLSNFSYRYLEVGDCDSLKPTWTIDGDIKSVSVSRTISDLALALKTANVETRKGLIHLAKSFKKADKPEAYYELGAKVLSIGSRGEGRVMAFAIVSWDFPHYQSSSLEQRKEVILSFEDALELRNKFALSLEEVCEVF